MIIDALEFLTVQRQDQPSTRQVWNYLVEIYLSVADLGGGKGRATPFRPVFFHFHAVFGKNYAK